MILKFTIEKRYTVSVGRYDIYFSKNKSTIIKNIQISKRENISIVNSKYNELGFVREICNEVQEESFDNFL